MQKLVRGVHRFQSEVVPGQREFFAGLADGQAPGTLFITCSDSRINPNLLTQTEPGELFIVRNAGNLVPTYGHLGAEAAAVEFAAGALGVEHVIICGHSHCGAMSALLEPSSIQDLPALTAWLAHAEVTRRVMKENYPHHQEEELLSVCIQENVLAQLEALRTHPVVAARLARGKLQLHGWVYKLETGEVFAFDPAEDQFKPLAAEAAQVAPRRRALVDPARRFSV
jgi:carbonic anhydrase